MGRAVRFLLPLAILAALVGLLIYAGSTPRSAAIVIPAGTAPQLAEPDRLRLSGAPEPGSHGNGAPAPAAPPPTPKEEVGVTAGLAASDAPSARPTPQTDKQRTSPRPSAGPPAPRASLAGGRNGPRSPAATRPAKVQRPAASVAPAASSCDSPCTVDLTFLVRTGLASTYGPRFSEWWVALPDGPGWRFRVCGPGGCRELVSTDAGPDLAMQRLGRIVDLPVGAFGAVCGVPWTYGLCPVEVTLIGRVTR